MSLSKTAKSKWLAACLFSATVLAGFQLQQQQVHAQDGTPTTVVVTPNNQQGTTSVTTATSPNNGSLSGVVNGSFGNDPHTTTSNNSSSSTSSTNSGNGSNPLGRGSSSATSDSTSAGNPKSTDPASSSDASHSSSSTSSSTNTSSSTANASSNSSSTSTNSGSNTSSSATQPNATQNNGQNSSSTTQTNGNTQTASTFGKLTINTFDGLTHSLLNTSEYPYAIGTSITDKNLYIPEVPGYGYVGNVNTDVPASFTTNDATLNLNYMPLSPIDVNYIDMSNNKRLWGYSMDTSKANVGQSYQTNSFVIPFAGYKFNHVSDNSIGTIEQTVKSGTDLNPIVVNYYYQPEAGTTAVDIDTSNWTTTAQTTPIQNTNDVVYSYYLTRDELPAQLIAQYAGSTSQNHLITTTVDQHNSATTTDTSTDTVNGHAPSTSSTPNRNNTNQTGGASTTVPTEGNSTLGPTESSTIVTPNFREQPSNPTATPTATVTVINNSGQPVSQTTYTGQTGELVRSEMQSDLNHLRDSGYVILSNGVKGNTRFDGTNMAFTVKVTQISQATNPFKHNTMPIVAQLGAASQTANQDNGSNTNAANSSSARQNENQNNANRANSQNRNAQHQTIASNSAIMTTNVNDAQRSSQTHRQNVVNNGQTFGSHAAANGGGGGSNNSGLAAYFISISGKINLGARA
ncbi:MucBP domain-containing protein [Secundilactobacillus folii]|uniref:Mucin binding domain-containing protein n=1 Tax=Secundilactobacillus folii TaxID=2678357 RepID=A0A7X3C2W1_9LACO|nr:MucBP domain-containing protein [Secundilactobacillus folii]MTV81644.1 hypothetical protein [Secundilactobacillus folii]